MVMSAWLPTLYTYTHTHTHTHAYIQGEEGEGGQGELALGRPPLTRNQLKTKQAYLIVLALVQHLVESVGDILGVHVRALRGTVAMQTALLAAQQAKNELGNDLCKAHAHIPHQKSNYYHS